ARLDLGIVRIAERFDDPRFRRRVAAGIARDFGGDDGALLRTLRGAPERNRRRDARIGGNEVALSLVLLIRADEALLPVLEDLRHMGLDGAAALALDAHHDAVAVHDAPHLAAAQINILFVAVVGN